MTTLETKLRLAVQRIQERFGNLLLKKARSAEERGEQIFGLRVPFILDRSEMPAGFSNQTQIQTLANYDFKIDLLRIFYRRINSVCEMYDLDCDMAFLHVFCHELGHSKEARLFEEAAIFPYRFNFFSFGCPVRIDSQTHDLNSINISGRRFYELFMFGIQDYCVNKKLQESGIKNPLSKTCILSLPEIQMNELTSEQRHELVIRSLLLLPHNVDIYTNGGLRASEMEMLKGFHEKLVGAKWDLASDIMKDLEFGVQEKYVSVLRELFEGILETHVFQRWQKSSNLFATYKTIPGFWRKNRYRVFYVAPRDLGKEAEQVFSIVDSTES
jgi:hypothetical protein